MTSKARTTSSPKPSGTTTTGQSSTASSGATTARSSSQPETKLRIGYCRVSTDDDDQATSLDRQESLLQSNHCDLILKETGSATSADRPKYQQLLQLIESGSVGVVMAARDDRLNRNTAEAQHLFRLCRARAVDLQLLEDGVWQSVSHDDLALEEVSHERAIAAAAESRKISSRLKRSYRSAEQSGLTTIRKAPLGYSVKASVVYPDHGPIGTDADGQIVTEWQAARRAIEKVLALGSIRAGRNDWIEWLNTLIPLGDGKRLEQLQRMQAQSLGEWLRDPTLRGGRKARCYRREYDSESRSEVLLKNQNVEVVWDQHDALLTANEYKRIESIRERNTNRGFTHPRTLGTWHPIHRQMVCDHCQTPFTKITGSKTKKSGNQSSIFYYCAKRQRSKADCTAPGLSHKKLIEQLIERLPLAAGELTQAIGGAPAPSAELGRMKADLQAIEQVVIVTSNAAMVAEQQRLKIEITRLEHEAKQAATQHQGTWNDLIQMGDSDYWRTLLADPVAGHQTLVDKVERMTIRDGEVVELKLHDLEQPVWVAPLTDDDIEPATDGDFEE